MATLKQIANQLGLSVMAVSKALRDAPDISAATKARVRSEADRIGYVPNLMARGLRGGSSGLLGVIVPFLNDSFCSNMIWGLEQEAQARSYQILIGSSKNNAEAEWKTLQQMVERQVEAVFIFPVVRLQQRSPLLDVAAKRSLPMIFLDHYPAAAAQYDKVGWLVVDNIRGGELAAEHLLEQGHEKILYLSGPLTASSAAGHFTGVQRTMTKAGFPVEEGSIFLAGFDMEGGRDAMSRALAEGVGFSAVVCVNDSVALGACDVLRRQGYRIPQDVSVVGFGDGHLAANYSTPLTTVRQPQVDLGRAAFQLWHQALTRGEKLKGKILPVELIGRGSVGVPFLGKKSQPAAV